MQFTKKNYFGSMMVVMMFLDVFRVYLTAGFKIPRELTWVTVVVPGVFDDILIHFLDYFPFSLCVKHHCWNFWFSIYCWRGVNFQIQVMVLLEVLQSQVLKSRLYMALLEQLGCLQVLFLTSHRTVFYHHYYE